MCVPCKVIINNVMSALVQSVERILVDRDLHQDKIPYEDRMRLVNNLREIDLAAYSGDISRMPAGGVVGIILELEEKYGIIEAPNVWDLLKRP